METPGPGVALNPPFYTEPTLAPSTISQISPVPLSEIASIKVHQALIAKDVLFGLLGYEGNYVRFSERYDPSSLHHRIQGPDHKVAKHLDVSLKTMAKKLLRYGKHYSGLREFAAIYNHPHFGRANQRLCHEIAAFLDQYRHLVASFEHAFNTNATFSLAAMDNELQRSCADNLRHLYDIACTIHAETERRNPLFLSATSVADALSHEFARDDNFNALLQSIRNDVDQGVTSGVPGLSGVSSDPNNYDVCKGGVVLKIVHDRIAQFSGDRVSTAFLSDLYEAISRDYVELLNLWLCHGEVNDPFQEFFIKKNDLPQNIFYSNMERYWEELYVIKLDGLIPQFSSRSIQTKVLATGKLLNIFRQCIGSVSLRDLPAPFSQVFQPSDIKSLFAQDLTQKVCQFYERANALFMRVLFQGYHFHDILGSLHQTYLLCDSFKIDTFLDKTFHDLGRSKSSASTIVPINLYNEMFLLGDRKLEVKHLDSADPPVKAGDVIKAFEKFNIDASNFYDIAEEIINIKSFDAERVVQGDENASNAVKRLVSQSLQRAPVTSAATGSSSEHEFSGDSLIAGANIDLNLPFPLNLIITENLVFEYQLVFKLQMLLKFPSKLVDVAWKDITYSTVWNYKKFARPVQKLVLRCRVLMSRMRSFLNCLQTHLNYNVIETNYKQLSATAQKFKEMIDKPREAPESRRDPTAESQFFLKSSRNNNIFDAKIMSTRQVSSVEVQEQYNEMSELANHIGAYLNNMLRDCMITNTQLLRQLRVLLSVIAQFTSTTGRLKKTLVSMDADLLRAFSRDFPGKFDNIEYSETLVNNRIAGLADVLTGFWTDFNDGLQQFTGELEAVSTENASFGALVEKMAGV